MELTINKIRIRPSVNIGPNVKHVEEEGRFKFTYKQSAIIEEKIERIISDHTYEHASVKDLIRLGNVPPPGYDTAMHNQGGKFFRCAYVCAWINRDYGKALYWLRKAWACFEYDGVFVLKQEPGWDEARDDIWLYTDIQHDSHWSIAATVKVTSFLGTTNTSSHIGIVNEEADLTNMKVLLNQFEQHIKEQHEKLTEFLAK